MISSYDSVGAGTKHASSHIYPVSVRLDLPAHSVTKVPICTAHMPYTSCFWLDANFSSHEHEELDVSEAHGSYKTSCALYQSVLFKNSSKNNLPPGSVTMYFVVDGQKDEKKGANRFFHCCNEIYETQFRGCYLDQMAMIPINGAKGVRGVKERKSYKFEERTKKITESYVIQVTNEMCKSDIVVCESFTRAKKWSLSKMTPEKHDVIDSQQVAWHIPDVQTGDTLEIKYTVTYTWEGGSNEPESNMQLVEDASVFDEPAPSATSGGSFFSKLLRKH